MKHAIPYSTRAQVIISVVIGLLMLPFLCLSVRADTDVEFSGTLIAEPCQIDSDSEDMTIEFGAIAAKTFIDHAESAPKRFSVWLRECDLELGSQVMVTFNGNKNSENADYFAVNGLSKDIALKIVDGEGDIVKSGKQQEKQELNKGDTELQWQASIIHTSDDDVIPGDFYSTVNFLLEYP